MPHVFDWRDYVRYGYSRKTIIVILVIVWLVRRV